MRRRNPRWRLAIAVTASVLLILLSSPRAHVTNGAPPAHGSPLASSTSGTTMKGASERSPVGVGEAPVVQWSPTALGSEAPPARQFYGMTYDPDIGAIVMFGGEDAANNPLGDTWEFANGHWRSLSLAVSPSPRWAAGMAYDPALDGVFLFGGTNTTSLFDDSWLFNSTGWHELHLAYSPPPQAGSAMVYDSTDSYILLMYSRSGTSFVNVWTFNDGTWTNITASVGVRPPPVWFGSADNPPGGDVVFYGGSQGCYNPASGTSLTWTYSGGAFTNVTSQQTVVPSNAIGSQAMTFDPTQGGVVMFSSYTIDCVAVNTTYLFREGQWSNLTPTVGPPPPARWDARLVYAPGYGDVLFSGNEAPVGGVNDFGQDTWVLNATSVTSPTSSSGQIGTIGIYAAVAAVGFVLGTIVVTVWRGLRTPKPPVAGNSP